MPSDDFKHRYLSFRPIIDLSMVHLDGRPHTIKTSLDTSRNIQKHLVALNPEIRKTNWEEGVQSLHWTARCILYRFFSCSHLHFYVRFLTGAQLLS